MLNLDKPMDCLLINPRVPGDTRYPPLSLIYLAAYARQHGFTVEICDAGAHLYSDDQVLEIIARLRPRAIGFTFMTPQFPSVAVLSSKIAKNFSDTFQIAGGTHVNSLPEQSLSQILDLDCLVLGEGERTLVEVLEILRADGRKELSHVRGLALRDGEGLLKTPPRELFANLDDLPMPAWDLLPIAKYEVSQPGRRYEYSEGIALTISASRGCPYSCVFCASHAVFKPGHRQRSPKLVVDELEYLYRNHGVRHYFMVDEVLFHRKEYVIELSQELIRRKLPLIWAGNARVNSPAISDEVLEIAKAAGCVRIDFGVETGSPKILKEIRKGIKLSDVYSAHRMTHRHDLATTTLMMVGHPNETMDDVRDSIRLIAHIESDYPEFGPATPFPATELYDMAKEEGWLRSEDWGQYYISNSFRVMRNRFFEYDDIDSLSTFTNLISRIMATLANKKKYFPDEMKSPWRRFCLFYQIISDRYRFVPHEDFDISTRARLAEMFVVKESDPRRFEEILQSVSLLNLCGRKKLFVDFTAILTGRSERSTKATVFVPEARSQLRPFIKKLCQDSRIAAVKIIAKASELPSVGSAMNLPNPGVQVAGTKGIGFLRECLTVGTGHKVLFLILPSGSKLRKICWVAASAAMPLTSYAVTGGGKIIHLSPIKLAGMLLSYLPTISRFFPSVGAAVHAIRLTRLSGRLNSFQMSDRFGETDRS
jgi:anaerobic magnesium-protoporphyrin IX monomethyl ester cyclase